MDCLQDNVAAALAMQIAHEMDPSSQHHKHDMERLMRRIPQAVADVLEVQHACSLVCVRPKNVTIHAHGHMCIHACTHMHTQALQHVNTMCNSLVAQPMLVIVTTVVSSAVLCTSMSA